MAADSVVVTSDRLRLVAIGPERARDLWLVLSDPEVAHWYGSCPTLADVEKSAQQIALAWRNHGVHKWLAYDRGMGDVVGRGGCSRVPIDRDWGRLYAFLPDEEWVREPYRVDDSRYTVHALLRRDVFVRDA